MSEPSSLSDQLNQVLSRLADEIKNNRLQLPSPPENIIALRRLFQMDADINEIVVLLGKEPHISARLIKLANSVLFSSRAQVSSVKLAVARLGMQKVNNLVTGFAITQQFLAMKTKGLEQPLGRVWQTSEHVAATTVTLARHFSTIDPDQALLAGQVHNIGDAPLLIHINTLPEVRQNPELKHKVTQLTLKRMSAPVGSAILKKWSFPPDMVTLPYVAQGMLEPSSRINLPHLLQLAIAMRSCNFNSPLRELPPALLSSPAFSLLWQDESDALAELNGIAGEVVTARQLLGSM